MTDHYCFSLGSSLLEPTQSQPFDLSENINNTHLNLSSLTCDLYSNNNTNYSNTTGNELSSLYTCNKIHTTPSTKYQQPSLKRQVLSTGALRRKCRRTMNNNDNNNNQHQKRLLSSATRTLVFSDLPSQSSSISSMDITTTTSSSDVNYKYSPYPSPSSVCAASPLSKSQQQHKRRKSMMLTNTTLGGDRFIPERPLFNTVNMIQFNDLNAIRQQQQQHHVTSTSNSHLTMRGRESIGDDEEDAELKEQQLDNDLSDDVNTRELNMQNQAYRNELDNRLFGGQLKHQNILQIQNTNTHHSSCDNYCPVLRNSMSSSVHSDNQMNIGHNNNRHHTPHKYSHKSNNLAKSGAEQWETNIRQVFSHNKSQMLSGHNNIGSDRSANSSLRSIPTQPEKILDAPGLIDDYYLNLLDWSSNNLLAVALSDSVYLWNAETGDINRLLTCNTSNHVTSLSWIDDGSYLAVGTNENDVQLWDVEQQKKVRVMKGHLARVGALAWNSHILSSGSRSGRIINHDVRLKEHAVSTLYGHSQEVCGLKWSCDGSQLASGGNDNVLNIWDVNQHVSNSSVRNSNTINGQSSATSMSSIVHTEAKFSVTHHRAAVKALAWCPWNNSLLASGGGTQDRQLKFWNTQTGQLIQSIDTKSQVCSIIWSKHDRELVSSHGFSQNQLIVWKYPKLRKIAELTGHQSRVLHMAQSPDGTTVVSGAGDETLRFWNIFNAPKKSNDLHSCSSLLSMSSMNIRFR